MLTYRGRTGYVERYFDGSIGFAFQGTVSYLRYLETTGPCRRSDRVLHVVDLITSDHNKEAMMIPMRRTFVVLAELSVAACAPTVMQASLEPSDITIASQMLEPGTSTIKGSALFRQRGGGVVTCAGNAVFLVPATESASRELRRIFGADQGYVRRGGDASFGGGTLVATPEPNRRTVCNAQGFFTFDRVRAGRWHVMTSVIWTVGDEYQGGTLLGTTDVADGQEVEIVLSY